MKKLTLKRRPKRLFNALLQDHRAAQDMLCEWGQIKTDLEQKLPNAETGAQQASKEKIKRIGEFLESNSELALRDKLAMIERIESEMANSCREVINEAERIKQELRGIDTQIKVFIQIYNRESEYRVGVRVVFATMT